MAKPSRFRIAHIAVNTACGQFRLLAISSDTRCLTSASVPRLSPQNSQRTASSSLSGKLKRLLPHAGQSSGMIMRFPPMESCAYHRG